MEQAFAEEKARLTAAAAADKAAALKAQAEAFAAEKADLEAEIERLKALLASERAAAQNDLTSGEEAPSWLSSLPHAAFANVLRMLPLDDRARAACVCRTWHDAAADPALFAALWLDDSSTGWLNDAPLLQLCVRAGAALRELRLVGPASARVNAAGLIAALRAGGCAGVQRLMFPSTMGNYNCLSAEQAQQLAAACPALEHTTCRVECESADDVTTACARLPGPLTLSVITFDALRAALQLPAQMAGLEITGCTLDAACVAALGEALRANTSATLATLSLSYIGIGEPGAAAIGEALRSNTSLTTLELCGNDIDDAGAASLGQALRTNATLATLKLYGNGIGDAGATALANALLTNATLKELILDWCNDVGDAGAAALADALRTNTTLTKLMLNGRDMVGRGRG